MKIATLRFWALVFGLLTPELGLYIHQYLTLSRLMTDKDLPLTPLNLTLWAATLRILPLTCLGVVLSYVLWKWPRTTWGRFGLGAALDGAIVIATLAGVEVRF